MINKNLLYFLFIAVFGVGFVACDEEEVEVSTITNVPITLSGVDSDATLGETSRTVTVNFTLAENQIVDTDVRITIDQANTTATNGEDFLFSPTTVTVPAYVRTGSFTYEILEDLDVEGDEQIAFLINGVQGPRFGANNELVYTAVIRDSIYSDLMLSFDWEGDFLYAGGTYTLCPNLDLDIYVFDEEGNDRGIYDAATGDCPETLTLGGDLPDGVYVLAANLYDNGLDSLFLDVPYPITVNAAKGGVFNETFVTEDFFTSEDEDFVHDGVEAFKDVATITKTGGTFTITKPDGTVVARGLKNAPKLLTQ